MAETDDGFCYVKENMSRKSCSMVRSQVRRGV